MNDSSSNIKVIDVRSDTVTKPTPGMRQAIATAEVGDDVFRDDPTVLHLEEKMARMAGKEAALFVPSGTMGNLICVMAHCSRRGAELLLGDMSHIHLYEQGGCAQIAGVHPRSLKNLPDGTFDLQELEDKIRGDDPHLPVTSLVAIENSHNKCGGKSVSTEWIRQVKQICSKYGLPLHCDGARIFNSCVAEGIDLKTMLKDVDSASICLSKGLGCPIGSVIVGGKELIRAAIRHRKALGGGMRQSGLLAAAGLYALENNIERLNQDHANAKLLAEAINKHGQDRFAVDMKSLDTNIVLMWVDPKLTNPPEVIKRLDEGEPSVKCVQFSPVQVRFTFHLMITREDTDQMINKVYQVISGFINS